MSDDEQTPPDQEQKPLSERQLRLVEVHVATGNATEAARRAGYAFPNKIGPKLVNHGPVAAEIARRREEASKLAAMSLEEALGQLTSLAAGVEVAPKDRIAAIAQLGKYLGWEAARKHEHSGPGGGPMQIQPVASGNQAFEALKAAARKDPALAAELKKLAEE